MVHAGYGTQDSRGRQSISIANLSSGQVKDFPDDRLAEESHQSYFVGLAFSVDGKHLYASLGSITDPTGIKARRHRKRDCCLQFSARERSRRSV